MTLESFESWNWVEVDPSQSFAGLWKKNVADGSSRGPGAKQASFQIVRKEIHQNFHASKYDVKQPSDAT